MGSNKLPILTLIALSACHGSGVLAGNPPFENSIVSTDFDFIAADDPGTCESLRFLGRGTREMPDKRSEELMAADTFLFEAGFHDGSTVEIWAHHSFGTVESARHYALMVSEPLGKLPEVLRKKLSHVVIHQGDQTAFAEESGHFFVVYSENMETRVRHHDLEETVFHESVHAALERTYSNSRTWLSAQEADGEFITAYAARHPAKEDLPESALFAYTMLKHPGRLPPTVEQWVQRHMPNRLAFFRTVFSTSEMDAKSAGQR